ncbi:hypothetical protein [Fimbriiglobus ruber]|uniref:Uncharacterized protein n=1 Tax=Fimbriiglobus ruber TaxID=1908690 RepID=A0A225DGX6_9BACT|nr:hypothetical protein [Fimbriiglobus ruber]OWK35645.1 hypothetical protein FRUB_08208 [Fimbriiglobus ruber]
MAKPVIYIGQILAWAELHRRRTGRWPDALDGRVFDGPGLTWMAVDMALRKGLRGLPGGQSLAKVLHAFRQKRHLHYLVPLTAELILSWADGYHRRTGAWPIATSGPIPEVAGETWSGVESALRDGLRTLPGESSLARLFAEYRGTRNLGALPPFTLEQILAWADAHHARTGDWPARTSGPIPDAPGETWLTVDSALYTGGRGLLGDSSLVQLLVERRGVRNPKALPPFTLEQILIWADAHHARTGDWPAKASGPIPDAPGETWLSVDAALRRSSRGLPESISLAQLLAEHRGVRNRKGLPPLTREQILVWADAHHARAGDWPAKTSGPIPDAPGETWAAVDAALATGCRGLTGGETLPRLLAEYRGVRNHMALDRLTPAQILVWADAHHARAGDWPTRVAGPIPDAPGETWAAVDAALANGRRGLPGGESLARLFAEHRGRRNRVGCPRLTPDQILAWADAHHARTGDWPARTSGPIPEAPGETWLTVDRALYTGSRGLLGDSSLTQLLAERRGIRNPKALPPFTHEQILAWADAHHARTGRWPVRTSGPIPDAPGETWLTVDAALAMGRRGLPGGESLARLLARHRGRRNHMDCPGLTPDQILAWAAAHRTRTGHWPKHDSGAILDAPGETWSAVNTALSAGLRGLAGGTSLAKLLARHPEVRSQGAADVSELGPRED